MPLQENFPALLFTQCKIKAQFQSTAIKFGGMNLYKNQKQGQETPQEEGQTSEQSPAWSRQVSQVAPASKGTKGAPWPPPFHITLSNTDLSDHTAWLL